MVDVQVSFDRLCGCEKSSVVMTFVLDPTSDDAYLPKSLNISCRLCGASSEVPVKSFKLLERP